MRKLEGQNTELRRNLGGLTANDGAAALYLDVGAHAAQLMRVHEAVLKDVFRNDGSPLGLRGQGHILRLHVGREAGKFFCTDIGRDKLVTVGHTHGIGSGLDAYAAFFQLLNQ